MSKERREGSVCFERPLWVILVDVFAFFFIRRDARSAAESEGKGGVGCEDWRLTRQLQILTVLLWFCCWDLCCLQYWEQVLDELLVLPSPLSVESLFGSVDERIRQPAIFTRSRGLSLFNDGNDEEISLLTWQLLWFSWSSDVVGTDVCYKKKKEMNKSEVWLKVMIETWAQSVLHTITCSILIDFFVFNGKRRILFSVNWDLLLLERIINEFLKYAFEKRENKSMF